MFIKIFNGILDSSLADNRTLRHFFMDILLCSDPDGNVIMTKQAIAIRIRSTMEEVEWGLAELQKPDQDSKSPDCGGRRIVPLEGHGYGWKIVNYEFYRDIKTGQMMRDATADRVRKCRERKKRKEALFKSGLLEGEREYLTAEKSGATAEELDAIVTRHLK